MTLFGPQTHSGCSLSFSKNLNPTRRSWRNDYCFCAGASRQLARCASTSVELVPRFVEISVWIISDNCVCSRFSHERRKRLSIDFQDIHDITGCLIDHFYDRISKARRRDGIEFPISALEPIVQLLDFDWPPIAWLSVRCRRIDTTGQCNKQ